ncbi:ATP-binding cassette domain-containing protein [Streptomyces mirabilis]|uniref:ABC transporter ATP-binding protein n=1 Tax=Streptomyces mirabilis TaxID=68239 RepID=UPI003323F402
MIRFDSVSKAFPDGTIAVDNLSLEAAKGEISVFVGPSGCGKTTSVRMVNRLIEPTRGRILLDGRDVTSASPAQLRRGIGYVIQQAGLFPHKTVIDNISTVLVLVGATRRHARSRAAELLELVGLPRTFADRYPAQLSGGQQQRVGVARALAADPPVMLMDEPFSAVDPVVREQLQNEFLRIQQELSKTIIFVTHDIDEAIKMGDRIAVLRVGGTLAQFAPPADLLSRPADAFVAGFVGRDRGYRALGFTPAESLPLGEEPTVKLGDPVKAARERQQDGWVLVVDHEDRPVGWFAADGPGNVGDQTFIEEDLLHLGGTLAAESGSLREALDAALSSPSGRGVVVRDDGRFAGIVSTSQVLARIETNAAAARSTSDVAGEVTA